MNCLRSMLVGILSIFSACQNVAPGGATPPIEGVSACQKCLDECPSGNGVCREEQLVADASEVDLGNRQTALCDCLP